MSETVEEANIFPPTSSSTRHRKNNKILLLPWPAVKDDIAFCSSSDEPFLRLGIKFKGNHQTNIFVDKHESCKIILEKIRIVACNCVKAWYVKGLLFLQFYSAGSHEGHTNARHHGVFPLFLA